MKTNIHLLMLAALVTAGCATIPARPANPEIAKTNGTPVEDGFEIEATALPHSVSLPALMAYEFDGRDLKLGSVLDDNGVYTRYYITYESGDLTISGIMNIPKGEGPFPVLILNHGHIDTEIYTNGRGLKREQDYLARRGYAVLHPDYRNHAESDDDPNSETNLRIGYTEDVINAVYALRAANLPQIDASRVGMLGHSMGGGVTQNVLVVAPDLVSAAVLFAPVSSDYRDSFNKWMRERRETAARIVELFGEPDENPAFWDNMASRTFFDRVTAPVLIHHGTNDESVPLEWSEVTRDALESKGKDVTLHVYDGEPHEFINAWPLVMRRTVEFFDLYLK